MKIENDRGKKVDVITMDISLTALDSLSLTLDQARAISTIATDVDFDNYAPNTIQDYWTVLIEILEQAQEALGKLLCKY